WPADPDGAVVATSVVGFMVRKGNPKNIHDWSDLVQPGLQVLTPDPAQSGGAKWNIGAAYGAAFLGQGPGYAADNPADAQRLLEGVFKNVTVLDKNANDSFKDFESGNGDVAITYENQALAGLAAGSKNEFVIPSSTLSIQTPTVVVDKYAGRHCTTDIADAFVKYLHTPDAQAVLPKPVYHRPTDIARAKKAAGKQFPAIRATLSPTDDLGAWDKIVTDTLFGRNGAFTQAFRPSTGRRSWRRRPPRESVP